MYYYNSLFVFLYFIIFILMYIMTSQLSFALLYLPTLSPLPLPLNPYPLPLQGSFLQHELNSEAK